MSTLGRDPLDELVAEAELLARDVEEMILADPVIPYERARRVSELLRAYRAHHPGRPDHPLPAQKEVAA